MSKKVILTESQYKTLISKMISENFDSGQANHEEGFKLISLVGKAAYYVAKSGRGNFKVDYVHACKEGWAFCSSRDDGRCIVVRNYEDIPGGILSYDAFLINDSNKEECKMIVEDKQIEPRIIGLDFDGTVVTHRYPEIGDDIGAVPVLKELVEKGHKFILFTMRSTKNGTLQDAVNWFKENGIPLYGVNSNPTQASWTDSPKAYCHVYIDDAAMGIPKKFDGERKYVDWDKLKELLKEEDLL